MTPTDVLAEAIAGFTAYHLLRLSLTHRATQRAAVRKTLADQRKTGGGNG